MYISSSLILDKILKFKDFFYIKYDFDLDLGYMTFNFKLLDYILVIKRIYKTIPRNLYALQWAQPKDIIIIDKKIEIDRKMTI